MGHKIGDFYLLNQDNFIEKMPKIRLRDHGGEIVLGLCELYATLHFTDINKKTDTSLLCIDLWTKF